MLLYIITRERTDCHGGRGDRLGQGGRGKDRHRLVYAGRNRGVNYWNALAPRFTGMQGYLDKETARRTCPNPGQPGCDDCAYACRYPGPNKNRQKSSAAEREALPGMTNRDRNEHPLTACLAQRSHRVAQKNKYHLVREKFPQAYLTDVRWRRSSIHIPDLYFLPPSSASSAVTAARSFRSRPAGNDQYPYLPWGELGS